MRSAIEASLILSLSIVLTLLIMAVVFPRHALGGAPSAPDEPTIQPALFVHGMHDRPGAADSRPTRPSYDLTNEASCPYLAAIADASRCPALTETDAVSGCPYVERQRHQEPGGLDDPPVGVFALDI